MSSAAICSFAPPLCSSSACLDLSGCSQGPRCSHGFTLNTFLFSVLVEIDCLVLAPFLMIFFFFLGHFFSLAFAEHHLAFDHAQSVLVAVFIATPPASHPPLPSSGTHTHTVRSFGPACLHQPLVSLTDISVPQSTGCLGRNQISKQKNSRSNHLLSCLFIFKIYFPVSFLSPPDHISEAQISKESNKNLYDASFSSNAGS